MRDIFDNVWQSMGRSVVVWTALAFLLWLVLSSALSRTRLRGARLFAAAASWVLAHVLVPYATVALHWIFTVRR